MTFLAFHMDGCPCEQESTTRDCPRSHRYHSSTLRTDVIYVVTDRHNVAGYSPDGLGMIWFDSRRECAEDTGLSTIQHVTESELSRMRSTAHAWMRNGASE